MKKKPSVFHRILFFFNIIAALVFFPALMAGNINPEKTWWIYFFGFIFFPLYILHLFFFIYWLLVRKKYFLLPLPLLILGFSKASSVVALNFSDPKLLPGENTFKIMSYNVRLFDLYNWTHNVKTRDLMMNLIQAESPDIICIQEFFTEDPPAELENIKTLKEIQKAKYYHFHNTVTLHKTNRWGIATFSYYPIVNKGVIEFPGNTYNIAIWSDIAVNEDTIRVFNIHLQSNRLQDTDYELIEKISKGSQETRIHESKKVFSKLKNGVVKRVEQMEKVKREIEVSPYPVIVCGDFNDTPTSYVYRRLSENLKDAFTESGFGFGSTYDKFVTSFRIDYILHDPKFTSWNFRTIKKPYSDHYPIRAYMGLKK